MIYEGHLCRLGEYTYQLGFFFFFFFIKNTLNKNTETQIARKIGTNLENFEAEMISFLKT